MGRLHLLSNLNPTPAMDIDPRPNSYHSLCPTYIDPRRTKLLQEDTTGHVIGSPPPAGPPKTQWNETFEMDVPNEKTKDGSQDKDTSELSSRVQDITLQPPQPLIICETVEDVKTETADAKPSCSVSLSVPAVDFSNEKKRPPMSSPY